MKTMKAPHNQTKGLNRFEKACWFGRNIEKKSSRKQAFCYIAAHFNLQVTEQTEVLGMLGWTDMKTSEELCY